METKGIQEDCIVCDAYGRGHHAGQHHSEQEVKALLKRRKRFETWLALSPQRHKQVGRNGIQWITLPGCFIVDPPRPMREVRVGWAADFTPPASPVDEWSDLIMVHEVRPDVPGGEQPQTPWAQGTVKLGGVPVYKDREGHWKRERRDLTWKVILYRDSEVRHSHPVAQKVMGDLLLWQDLVPREQRYCRPVPHGACVYEPSEKPRATRRRILRRGDPNKNYIPQYDGDNEDISRENQIRHRARTARRRPDRDSKLARVIAATREGRDGRYEVLDYMLSPARLADCQKHLPEFMEQVRSLLVAFPPKMAEVCRRAYLSEGNQTDEQIARQLGVTRRAVTKARQGGLVRLAANLPSEELIEAFLVLIRARAGPAQVPFCNG